MLLFVEWTGLLLTNGPWFWQTGLRWPVARRDMCPCPGPRPWGIAVHVLISYSPLSQCNSHCLPSSFPKMAPSWRKLARFNMPTFRCGGKLCGWEEWEGASSPSLRDGDWIEAAGNFLHTNGSLNQKSALYWRKDKSDGQGEWQRVFLKVIKALVSY